MPSNSLIFFREFRGHFRARSLTFRRLSAESRNFPRIPFQGIIIGKLKIFRRIIRGKSKLPAYHTAEKHTFPQDNPRKLKTFRELSCGKFQYTAEIQISLFKSLSLYSIHICTLYKKGQGIADDKCYKHRLDLPVNYYLYFLRWRSQLQEVGRHSHAVSISFPLLHAGSKFQKQ